MVGSAVIAKLMMLISPTAISAIAWAKQDANEFRPDPARTIGAWGVAKWSRADGDDRSAAPGLIAAHPQSAPAAGRSPSRCRNRRDKASANRTVAITASTLPTPNAMPRYRGGSLSEYRRIGTSIARKLARQAARMAVAARDRPRLDGASPRRGPRGEAGG